MKMPIIYDDAVSLGAEEWISLSKPGLLMNAVRHEPECEVLSPTLLSAKDFCAAHDPRYVADVFSGRRANGFGNVRTDVLEQVVAANSCFVTAAEVALERGVAFAPVSGFHHAGYSSNFGYCTFNGLMIAAERLWCACKVRQILILDFDGHYGDGTDDIIDMLGLSDSITHLTRHKPFEEAEQATAAALSAIGELPDLVMLQAGADSLLSDPFGAGYFTNEQWVERDQKIFRACKSLGVPIVWNLAGGYDGQHTVKMHYATWRSACDIFASPPSLKKSPLMMSSGGSVPFCM